MLTRSTDEPEKLTVQSLHKEEGAADLSELALKHLKTDEHGALIDELHGILKVELKYKYREVCQCHKFSMSFPSAGVADRATARIRGYLRTGYEYCIWVGRPGMGESRSRRLWWWDKHCAGNRGAEG